MKCIGLCGSGGRGGRGRLAMMLESRVMMGGTRLRTGIMFFIMVLIQMLTILRKSRSKPYDLSSHILFVLLYIIEIE